MFSPSFLFSGFPGFPDFREFRVAGFSGCPGFSSFRIFRFFGVFRVSGFFGFACFRVFQVSGLFVCLSGQHRGNGGTPAGTPPEHPRDITGTIAGHQSGQRHTGKVPGIIHAQRTRVTHDTNHGSRPPGWGSMVCPGTAPLGERGLRFFPD